MQDEEFSRRIGELRPIATNIIGFHDLSENHADATPLSQAIYHAQTYANGVILAQKLCAIFDELERSHDD